MVAIGNPISLKNSVAAGILSGHECDFVKIDAKIYPGNSSGPLVDESGRVIGINTMKLLTRNYEGLGFAIPIETAVAEFSSYLNLRQIAAVKRISRPYHRTRRRTRARSRIVSLRIFRDSFSITSSRTMMKS